MPVQTMACERSVGIGSVFTGMLKWVWLSDMLSICHCMRVRFPIHPARSQMQLWFLLYPGAKAEFSTSIRWFRSQTSQRIHIFFSFFLWLTFLHIIHVYIFADINTCTSTYVCLCKLMITHSWSLFVSRPTITYRKSKIVCQFLQ